MWQRANADFLPDSLDEGLRVVYDEPERPEEPDEERAYQRPRRARSSAQAEQPRDAQGSSPGGSGSGSPTAGAARARGGQTAAFALEVQTLLQGMTQQPGAGHGAEDESEEAEWERLPLSSAAVRTSLAAPVPSALQPQQRPGSGRRGPMHNSPAVPPSAEEEQEEDEADTPACPHRSGRRWRPQQRQAAPQLPPPPQPRRRAVGWNGGGTPVPQTNALAALGLRGGGTAAAGDVTPVAPARPAANPLAVLLGGGASAEPGGIGGGSIGSAAKGARAATTGKLKGRNPLYRSALSSNASTGQQAAAPSPQDGAAGAQRRVAAAQQLHRLYGSSSRDPGAPPPASQLEFTPSSSRRQAAPGGRGGGGASSLQQLLGGSAGGRGAVAGAAPGSHGRPQQQRQQQRGTPLVLALPEHIDAAEGPDERGAPPPPQQLGAIEGEGQLAPLPPEAAAAAGAAAAEAVTPGPGRLPGLGPPNAGAASAPPVSWYGPPPSTVGGRGHTAAAAAAAQRTPGAAAPAPSAAAGAVDTPGTGGLSLQRQFIAQLAPVSRPAVPPAHQQKQRMGGAVGLHGWLQASVAAAAGARSPAIATAEKAEIAAAQRQAGPAPRLTIVRKELDASLTNCDAVAAAELGAPQAVAFLQGRTAREVDTHEGCGLLLRRPWHLLRLEGCPWPVVLCLAVEQGCGTLAAVPAAATHSPSAPGAFGCLYAVTLVASACFLVTARFHSAPPALDSTLPGAGGAAPGLPRMRALGEQLAVQFPGARMGAARPAPISVDWHAVRESCAPGRPLRIANASADADGTAPRLVLVTGAAGFIGMHTAIKLRARGDGVVGLDNFNDYYPVSLKRARQVHAAARGVYTVEGDINDKELLYQLFDACPFTHVVHLAAQAGVRYAAVNPGSYVRSNLAGEVALFEVAKARRAPPAVVYASSSSVYGLNTKQPFSEDDRVDAPASLYAATKRADELIAHVYSRLAHLSMTGLRFFTVYGPWGRPDMAAYKFAVTMMRGEPITIYQGPNATELSRDFTYIDDIVAGVVAAVDTSPPSVKGQAAYRIFNLGNTQPHTVTQLVGLLERHFGRAARTRYVPLPPTGDVLATYADVSRARGVLGYTPATPLDEGIRRFARWFRSYYGLEQEESGGGGGGDASRRGGVALPQPADWSYRPF
eukprot:scaffold5.g770.t1